MYYKCQKCGKKLTDPESMQRGYGPECWNGISNRAAAKGRNMILKSEDEDIPGQMNIFDYPECLPESMCYTNSRLNEQED